MAKRSELSRREREIMDIVYARNQATAAEIREAMESPPSYSAVRATLRVLVEKGHVKHRQDGPRYVYLPTVPATRARQSALRHMLSTFFKGSVHSAVAALLDLKAGKLSNEELDRLSEMIEEARQEGQ
ncbi:MAG: BlaI/MecI/CopY family transcriptional regulator [Planctomycetota bacterium]